MHRSINQFVRSESSLLLAVAVALAAAAPAQAGFIGIPELQGPDISGQLQLQLSDPDANPATHNVRFTISNLGPVESTIASVYFDPGTFSGLGGPPTIASESPGVSFKTPGTGSPHSLPNQGNATPAFQSKEEWRVTSENPPPKKGVGPSEFVSLDFNLTGAFGVADVQQALNTGNLRVGLHVISISDGGKSDSYVTAAVPEPGTGLAGLGALAVLGWRGWRRRA